MLSSKLQILLVQLARPSNLLRLGMLAFLLATLTLRLPVELQRVANPDLVQAAPTCTDGKCESAGHCWSQGTKAGSAQDGGCEYTCRNGGWTDRNCAVSQEFKDRTQQLYNQYQQQVAGTGGGGTTTTTAAPVGGVGITGGAVCGAGSAGGCSGQAFYSTDPKAAGYKCFPNGTTAAGVTLCGRDTAANVRVTTTSNGQTVGGYVVQVGDVNGQCNNGGGACHNASTGGCGAVVQCGCATGMQSTCLRDQSILGSGSAADYCARVVCAPIGSNGKVCTPGQVEPGSCGTADPSGEKFVSSTLGKICNADGKTYSYVNTHACGATHTVATCARTACIRETDPYPSCPGGTKCVGTTYNTQAACEQANGGLTCTKGIAQVSQSVVIQSNSCAAACGSDNLCNTNCRGAMDSYVFCSNSCTGANAASCRDACRAASNSRLTGNARNVNLVNQYAAAIASGSCIQGANYSTFDGCGSGSQVTYNCYKSCTNGVSSRVCRNEPGLSCGAFQKLTPTQQAIAAVVQARTVVNPTPPPPTPTPTPTATCNESCGNGVVCTGANMACVNGTCKSTLCAPADQNSQCICNPPPPVAPICVDIWASKTAPVLNDQVTFTCAQVNNTERYEFRYVFTQNKTSLSGAQVFNLAPASTTSNVSQPITIDKIGRYIAQCRPCAANNLCQEWEPLDGQIGPPELAPENAAAAAASSAAGTSATTTTTTTTTTTATGSGTATTSGTMQ